MNSKQRFIAALEGRPADHVPVFPLLMFFTADRAGLPYREFVTNGRALAEAQLAMRERFGLNAITCCSDAYRIPADLGADLGYPENHTPAMNKPLIQSAGDLRQLGRPDPTRAGSRMADRLEAIRIMAEAAGAECAVLGWVEMPFAEACSMCGLQNFMMLMIADPPLAHAILDHVAGLEIEFARAQLAAGADMIGCGDAAASLISPEMYREFALPHEQRVAEAVRAAGGRTKLHVCGDTSALLPDMARAGCDLYNVDHLVDFTAARDAYSAAGKCFKGNLDPVSDLLNSTPGQCRAACRERIERAEGHRYMLSAGCEIPPGVTDEVFEAFCRSPLEP